MIWCKSHLNQKKKSWLPQKEETCADRCWLLDFWWYMNPPTTHPLIYAQPCSTDIHPAPHWYKCLAPPYPWFMRCILLACHESRVEQTTSIKSAKATVCRILIGANSLLGQHGSDPLQGPENNRWWWNPTHKMTWEINILTSCFPQPRRAARWTLYGSGFTDQGGTINPSWPSSGKSTFIHVLAASLIFIHIFNDKTGRGSGFTSSGKSMSS